MRPRHRLSFAVLAPAIAGAVLVACGTSTGPGEGPPAEITNLPRDLTPAERSAIRSGNAFGVELLRRLHAGREADEANVFISPLSASMSLGMALAGADGETFDAMRRTLALGDVTPAEAGEGYGELVDLLLGLDPSVEVGLANSAWLREGFPILPAYRSRVEEAFGARVESVPFAEPSTADAINAWVEETTAGRITDFVEPGRIADLVALLANTVYFEGSWTSEFDPDRTRPGDFRRPDGTTVTAPMMRQELEAGYVAGDGFVAADLPYGGRAFSMTVLVPAGDRTLDAVVDGMDADAWGAVTEGLRTTEIAVVLPRFELTYEKLLNDALKAMGMEIAFDGDRADFGRMADLGATAGNLYIGWVKQTSFVRVDEEGTEAAAATGTGIEVTSAPPTVRADRPFLFAIRERLSGTILFVGTVTDPTAE